MEDRYGSDVHEGLEKSACLWSVHLFMECPFCCNGFLRNSSGTKFFVRLREVSALEDVHFSEVPLYLECIWRVLSQNYKSLQKYRGSFKSFCMKKKKTDAKKENAW